MEIIIIHHHILGLQNLFQYHETPMDASILYVDSKNLMIYINFINTHKI